MGEAVLARPRRRALDSHLCRECASGYARQWKVEEDCQEHQMGHGTGIGWKEFAEVKYPVFSQFHQTILMKIHLAIERLKKRDFL